MRKKTDQIDISSSDKDNRSYSIMVNPGTGIMSNAIVQQLLRVPK